MRYHAKKNARKDGDHSPASGETSLGRDIPLLGMLLDRTSFDEAGDLGVDQENIKTRLAERGDETNFQAPPPILMKNGKVRRRLRWRVRSPRKQQSVERLQQCVTQQRGRLHYRVNRSPSNSGPKTPKRATTPTSSSTASSGGSVVSASNYSQVSKQSKLSVHSFASTETAAISNKQKDKLKRFMIKRPNYPNSLDPADQTTIGTEGEIVHAKLNSSVIGCTPIFPSMCRDDASIAEADESSVDESSIDDEGTDSVGILHPSSHHQLQKKSSQEKKGLPPLGRKVNLPKSRSFGSFSIPLRSGDGASVISGLSMGSSSYKSGSPIASVKSDLSASVNDGTVRLDDDMEEDRRVDLRIVPSSCSSVRSESRNIKRSSKNDEEFVHELKSNSFPLTSPRNKELSGISPVSQQLEEQRQDLGESSKETSDLRDVSSSEDRREKFLESDDDAHTTRSFASERPRSLFMPFALKSVFSESFVVGLKRKQMGRRTISFGDTKDKTSNQNDLNPTSDVCSHSPVSELRFSMSGHSSKLTVNADENLRQSNEPGLSPPSCILDVAGDNSSTIDEENKICTIQSDASLSQKIEDSAFLEAEKNLQAIQEVATEHLQQGEYSEALEVFQEILRGLLTRYGEEHPRVGTAVHNIGVVHMRRSDYTKAVVAYKEAVRVRKMVLENDHPDVAVSLAQLGMAYLELNKHQRAIGAFREALRIRRKCYGNYHSKVGKVLNNIGCALYELDELEVARVAFEEALDIQRRILKNDSNETETKSNDAALLSIASTQSNIASIKLYYGEFDEALLDLEEALLMQESVLGDDNALVQRTRESLEWLEVQRAQQQEFLAKQGSNVKVELFDASIQARDIKPFFNKNAPPSTITELAETDKASIANGVFRTLERSFRKLHADLDYMSCGTA